MCQVRGWRKYNQSWLTFEKIKIFEIKMFESDDNDDNDNDDDSHSYLMKLQEVGAQHSWETLRKTKNCQNLTKKIEANLTERDHERFVTVIHSQG